MRWHDLMTVFWAALMGAATATLLYAVASPSPAAIPIGAVGGLAMTAFVYIWRTYLKP